MSDSPAEIPFPDPALERLTAILESLGPPLVVAFSGGLDSTFLLYWAARALGPEQVRAVTAVAPVFPRLELEEACAAAARLGVPHHRLVVDLLALPAFRRNPPDRCYHCKHRLFSRMLEFARELGAGTVCDGTQADDSADYRPGRRALRELGVRSPLAEAGIGKDRLRRYCRRLGLAAAGKPSGACLASRFPYGTPVTAPDLARIERAEASLAALGFDQVRVRFHGDTARIELAPDRLEAAVARRAAIVHTLKACGFRYVALDLEGYRTGSLNEGLGPGTEAPGGGPLQRSGSAQ